ncbi:MAG: cytochrome c oxidase accessory protein CcoG [Roseiarcus sp.]
MSQTEIEGAHEVYDEGPLYVAEPKVYPQKVSGTFRRLKWTILIVCLGIYYFLPFVRWDRGPNEPHQAVLADIAHSRFYFFFIEIWPQEVYYFTGILVLAAMALFLSNALFGRVWCGYFCVQTVWTDLFLWVERLVEGDRRDRIKLDAAPWSADKIGKRIAKHGLWVLIAAWTGGAWVLYFADAPALAHDILTLHASMVAYVWIGIFTFTTYYLAGHMREDVCLYMCPWPRIQAALTDVDALNVTYRRDRGEPRMSLKEANKARAAGQPAGDCVDCDQCFAACPTGVDIRKGSQLGCIQCGLCIDACDTVMKKIHRPTRLIAYDTDENMARRQHGEAPVYRLVRPRTILYVVVMAIVGSLMLYKLSTRQEMGLSVLHVRAPMYTTSGQDAVRNGYTLRFSNKWSEPRTFAITISGVAGAVAKSEQADTLADGRLAVTVDPDATQEIEFYVTALRSSATPAGVPIVMTATDLKSGAAVSVSDHFFGP